MSRDAFRGRVAVVTGGASGIGLAAAHAFARAGCLLVLADIEESALASAVAQLEAKGATVLGVRTDVSSRESVFELADRAWSHFGAVHILMHNAGVMTYGPTATMSHEDWLFNININLWGPIHGVEAFASRMQDQRDGGHHVFTASFAGLVPGPMFAPYNVAKAGVVALAETLSRDLRLSGSDIGVSILCPQIVHTNIENSTRNRPESLGGPVVVSPTEEERAHYGRILSPESVADLLVDGIRNRRLYIHTHREAMRHVQRRAERLLAAFDHAL
jgi:NAD(P)-dependent dehydrogenase (short-subunit alcohol dehydrogenase family)